MRELFYPFSSSAKNIQIENVTDDVSRLKKILDMTFSATSKSDTFLPFDDFTYEAVDSVMFVLAEDKNTGYAVINARTQGVPKPEAALQQVFDSFELIGAANNTNTSNVSNATTTTTTTNTSSLSPFQQQPLPQQQQHSPAVQEVFNSFEIVEE
jgi:hypothetical protein